MLLEREREREREKKKRERERERVVQLYRLSFWVNP